MIVYSFFPSYSEQVATLLGPERYAEEARAVSRFCRTQQEVDLFVFLLYQQAIRWNQGFGPQDTWDSRNLNESERSTVYRLASAFDSVAIQHLMSKKKWIDTLLRIEASASVVPGIDTYAYQHKFRGTLAPSFACFYRQNGVRLEVIFVLERIYKGSSGKKVYHAIDLNTWQHKAVTIWPTSEDSRREATLPFQLQMQNCKSLMTPYETLLEVSKVKGGTKIVAVGEYCNSDCVKTPLSYKRHREAILAVLEAAAYMDAQGWVHKDIKPDNILRGSDGSFKLADYSLSCPVGELNAAGTNYYASPETFRQAPASAASAVWEIGITGLALLGYPIRDNVFLEAKEKHSVTDAFIASRINLWFRRKKTGMLSPLWPLLKIYVSCLKLNPAERPTISHLIEEINKIDFKKIFR